MSGAEVAEGISAIVSELRKWGAAVLHPAGKGKPSSADGSLCYLFFWARFGGNQAIQTVVDYDLSVVIITMSNQVVGQGIEAH
jgi:hypothetical protein